MALIKGLYYVVYFRLLRKNVKIRYPFKVFSKINIIGSGSVLIDKNCAVLENGFRGLSIVTLSEKASVNIGKNCLLGGLTIRCQNKVIIKDRTMTANSLIQDVSFVNRDKVQQRVKEDNATDEEGVFIGNNVWLGGHSIILSRTKIGDDSVIGACSLCWNTILDKFCFGSGSPVKRGFSIERLLQLKGGV